MIYGHSNETPTDGSNIAPTTKFYNGISYIAMSIIANKGSVQQDDYYYYLFHWCILKYALTLVYTHVRINIGVYSRTH
ncbi:MAG: hypothetical protein NVS4B1_02540 [Ktedonobacteraceae bacterium]